MKRTIIIVFFAFWGTLFAAVQESFKVSFDLRYDAHENIPPVSVKPGCALPMTAKPFPQKEGQ